MIDPLGMGCRCGCGRSEYDTRVLKAAMRLYDLYESRYGFNAAEGLMITSGFRCLHHDQEVNPDPSSTRQHTRGKAVDFGKVDASINGGAFTDEEINSLEDTALSLGATGIGKYRRSFHMDFRDEKHITGGTTVFGRKVQIWNKR